MEVYEESNDCILLTVQASWFKNYLDSHNLIGLFKTGTCDDLPAVRVTGYGANWGEIVDTVQEVRWIGADSAALTLRLRNGNTKHVEIGFEP